METLAGNLCQAMATQISSQAVDQLLSPAGDDSDTPGWHDPDFSVGESFAQLNPVASSLLSACTALHAGGRILCRIEVELGVPQTKSILPADIPLSTAPVTATEGRGAVGARHKRKGSLSVLTQAARFLDAMSESEGAADGGEFGYMQSLNNFQRDYAEIQRMAKQHTFALWSQVLSLQTRRI